MSDLKRRVVDKRNKEKFFVDDYFLDTFSRIIGSTGTILYLWLCRHADKEGECYPSQETLAEKLAVDVRTIRRNLEALVNHHLISIVRFGKTKTNRYYLLDKSQWVKEPEVTGQKCPVDTEDTSEEVIGQECPISDRTKMSAQNQSDRTFDDKVTGHLTTVEGTKMSGHSKGAQLRVPDKELTVTNVTVQDEPAKHNVINDMFKIFQEINPTINYGNKTERSAAQRLVDRLGEEKALSSARAALMASKSIDQFAPSITTPLELERKMGKLLNFYHRNSETKSYALQTTDPNL